MSEPAVAPEKLDPDTRIEDGTKEFRIKTTNGCRFLLRAFVSQGGWYKGAKELARRRKLAKAIGKEDPPTAKGAQEVWDKVVCEFWLSDKLKEHARKCLTFIVDQGAISGGLDDDGFEQLMVELGMEMKDD